MLCAGKVKRAEVLSEVEGSGLPYFFAPLFVSRQKVEKDYAKRKKIGTSIKYREAPGQARDDSERE